MYFRTFLDYSLETMKKTQPAPDFEALTRSVLRALRGKRSQTALSRRLGYSSNVVYRWEAGKRWPNASEWFRLLVKVKAPLGAALGYLGPGLDRVARKAGEPGSEEHQLAVLRSLSDQSSTQLAAATGLPDYSVRRLLRGATQPSLPVFFQLVEATTGRLVPFLEALVPPEALEPLGASYQVSRAQRAIYRKHRWTEALLAALECSDYRAQPAHSVPWLARQLGLPEEEIRGTIEDLLAVGGLVADGKHYRTQPQRTTHMGPDEAALLRQHWAEVVVRGEPEHRRTGYIVFSCSDEGLNEVRRILRQAFADIRTVIGAQTEANRVVLMTTSLAALDKKTLPS